METDTTETDTAQMPLVTETVSEETQKKLAEAALFMASEPLTLHELTKIMKAPSFSISLKVLDELTKEFNNRDSALHIVKVDESRFQMQVKPSYVEAVSHLAIDTDFSKATLRTLGLIAVKQPVRQSLIVKIIGNKAYDYVKELQEKGFVKTHKQGSTKVIEVTPRFNTYFGKQVEELKKMV